MASVRDTESEIPSYNDGDRNLAKRKEECSESSLVLRFDLFEFLVDDLLYPHGLLVEMGQFARAFQPGLALALEFLHFLLHLFHTAESREPSPSPQISRSTRKD